MKTPVGRGDLMPMQGSVFHDSAPAIRWRHKHLDGSGYPDKISGDSIPVKARVLAVTDVWDALTSDHAYPTAISPAAAREIMTAEAGIKLNDDCVRALVTAIDRAPTVTTLPNARAIMRPLEQPLPSFLAN